MNEITYNDLQNSQVLGELSSNGYFNVSNFGNIERFRDAMPTQLPNNIGMPAGILSALNPKAVSVLLKKRNADLVYGKRQKLLNWEDEEYFTPIVERTGQSVPYSDDALPIFGGLNLSFNKTGHYRFTCAYRFGDLEARKITKARLNYTEIITSATSEALASELNRAAFNGYIENNGNAFLCYGLLNNPNLDNVISSAKTFENMSWEEINAFFAKAIGELVKKSGQNISLQSNIKVAISSEAFTILRSLTTSLGISIYQHLLNTYENLKFIPANELDGAHNNQNVIYFIGEDEAGGIDETMTLGYSELGLMSNTEIEKFGYSQAMSAGTTGGIIYKPLFIVRYTGI